MSEVAEGTRGQSPDDVRRPKPLPQELPAAPPRAEPIRANRVYPGKPWALWLGGALALVLVVGIAIALLSSGKRPESTQPSAEGPKGTQPIPKGSVGEPKVEPKVEPKAAVRKAGDTCEVEIAPGVKTVFCWVPPSDGEVQLGSPPGEELPDDEDEQQRGKKSFRGFWMGKYEVTQAEWEAVVGTNPSYFSQKGEGKEKVRGKNTSRFPAEQVSWDMIRGQKDFRDKGFLEKANAHIQKATSKAGELRLPHEDEWEYACRAGRGNTRPFYWGDTLNGTQANTDGINFPYGTRTKGTYLERTCAVDATNDEGGNTYERHPWGLMHMHGNVLEWCENLYDKSGAARVLRGGSWNDHAIRARSAYRNFNTPDSTYRYYGFRVCFSPP